MTTEFIRRGKELAAFCGLEKINEDLVLPMMDNADLEQMDVAGDTPLLSCAFFGRRELVRALIARKANVNVQDPSCGTALMSTVGKFNGVALDLIAAGADANIANNNGRIALHYFTEKLRERPLAKELGLALIAATADVNKMDEKGSAPLHLLMMDGNPYDPTLPELVEALLKKGADPDLRELPDENQTSRTAEEILDERQMSKTQHEAIRVKLKQIFEYYRGDAIVERALSTQGRVYQTKLRPKRML